jgi:Family of unknown function (DUF5703)
MLMADYCYRVLYLPRGTSRDAARRILTDHAEYGNWELSRLRLYPDGSRRATLRRLIIRQAQVQLGMRSTIGRRGPSRGGHGQYCQESRYQPTESADRAGPPGAADGPAANGLA